MILRKEWIAFEKNWNECICLLKSSDDVEGEEDNLFKRVGVNLPSSYVQRLQKPLELYICIRTNLSRHSLGHILHRREMDAIPLCYDLQCCLSIHIVIFSGYSSVKHLCWLQPVTIEQKKDSPCNCTCLYSSTPLANVIGVFHMHHFAEAQNRCS